MGFFHTLGILIPQCSCLISMGMGECIASSFRHCITLFPRVVNNSSFSLLAQVLKAGYYPSSDFMQASLGYNPSYTWRSIHAARQVLHKGLCWRIGNGRSVRIWKDGWLPKQCGFRVWSRSNLLDENATVDSLLQEDGLGWNIPLLEQVLLPFEVAQVKQLYLSPRQPQDKLVWQYSKTGSYTVRSAYHLLMQQPALTSPGTSSGTVKE